VSIQGLQIIYRLKSTIRLFLDYRDGVDSFNLYYSDAGAGVYSLLSSVENKPSKEPATKNKVVFEFYTENLANWDNNKDNYIKLAPVVNNVEGALEGPLVIPTRVETVAPKEFSVMYGLDKDAQKFVPISVDSTGKIMTV